MTEKSVKQYSCTCLQKTPIFILVILVRENQKNGLKIFFWCYKISFLVSGGANRGPKEAIDPIKNFISRKNL